MITRRAAMLGGLCGLTALGATSLTACSSSDDVEGTLVSGSFVSRRRKGASTGWSIIYPPKHDRRRLPVLVALHGRTGHHSDAYRSLHLDKFLAQTVADGGAPFAIASVDGGDHDYWHPRASGVDPAGMVIDEFLPLLDRQGLDVRRVGFMGWSMGGYGALYLAGRLGRARTAVAIAESPAIWHHAYQVVEGSFDSAEDWAAHSIWRTGLLAGIPMRIDCGSSDGFAPVTRDLRAKLHPTPAGGIEPGGHDSGYWRTQAPAQLRFAAQHLSAR
jgi:enterochelin esterase-like enzyme